MGTAKPGAGKGKSPPGPGLCGMFYRQKAKRRGKGGLGVPAALKNLRDANLQLGRWRQRLHFFAGFFTK